MLARLSRDIPYSIRDRLLYDWIKQRTGFSDTRLRGYLQKFGYSTEAERYNAVFYLASYAGEPTSGATDSLTDRMVAAREIFLQRPGTVSGDDLDLALMSGVPSIQIKALKIARDKFNIPDPEIIPWTLEVILYYDDLFRKMPVHEFNRQNLMIAGYLQIKILDKIPGRFQKQDYIPGYFWQRCKDPWITSQRIGNSMNF